MKKLLMLVCVLFLSACATTGQLKYEKQPFTSPPKSEEYKLPPDPFASLEPPKPIFLAKQKDGTWKEVPKDQGEVIAYFPKEHDKIVLRLQYYKELTPELVKLVNIQIKRGNVLIDLVVDQQVAKELYRELYIETYNLAKSDKMWNGVEKAGLWAVIIGQLILLIQ